MSIIPSTVGMKLDVLTNAKVNAFFMKRAEYVSYSDLNLILHGNRAMTLRPYLQRDRTKLVKLLSVLPRLYPNGATWLDRRLDKVIAGKAYCTVVAMGNEIVGATIETPKGLHTSKLSTIYIHPSFRGLGIGHNLLSVSYRTWLTNEIRHVTVTADLRKANTIFPLLKRFGFIADTVERNRYGDGRDEVVFTWVAS